MLRRSYGVQGMIATFEAPAEKGEPGGARPFFWSVPDDTPPRSLLYGSMRELSLSLGLGGGSQDALPEEHRSPVPTCLGLGMARSILSGTVRSMYVSH